MKIILETDPELGLKISGDPKIPYVVAFGMLKLAMEHLSCNYNLLIDANNNQAKKLKTKKPSREKKEH